MLAEVPTKSVIVAEPMRPTVADRSVMEAVVAMRLVIVELLEVSVVTLAEAMLKLERTRLSAVRFVIDAEVLVNVVIEAEVLVS
jgi:hypothetical protein